MDGTLEEKRQELYKLKLARDLKKSLHETKILMKLHSDDIPLVEQLNEDNKGAWIEHDEETFNKMFNGLLDYCADEECYDNLDWDSVNYTVLGADYYKQKFPGFSDEVYEILAKSTEEENKFVDNRIPPMKIKHEEVTLSFK
jgi:hypothetical protein